MSTINPFNVEDHLKFRNDRYQTLDKNNKKLLGLSVIELNPTELCNRTCSFCPRHDPILYPNQNLNMSTDTAKELVRQLVGAEYKGDIHITGYGEPLLNPDILKIISIFSQHFHTELITNGDRLNSEFYSHRQLKDSGLNFLIVDCYDGDEHVIETQKLLEDCEIPYRIRNHHDTGTPQLISLFNFNNRGGLLTQETLARPCWIPFYKAFIDWNGDVGLCCNDWSRKQPSFGNINNISINEIWMSDSFVDVRKQLEQGLREKLPACKNCNTMGIMQGFESVKIWQDQI
jgi:MoaA/NifB/PqqE/SkfB family radical SAM enzyme